MFEGEFKSEICYQIKSRDEIIYLLFAIRYLYLIVGSNDNQMFYKFVIS